MPRVPRLQFDGAFYHVYHRGNRRQPIFIDASDYSRFEFMLLEAMQRSGIRIYSWKLMPNHFHLLIETPYGNLAEFMQRLLTRYAMYFNWRHQQVGHVFQGRYGAKICDKEAYFKELVRYIQLNAYRTKGRTLAKVGEWKWSSHRYLMMPEKQWPDGLRIAFRELLGRFGKDPYEARRAYATFLADGLKDGSWRSFYRPRGGRFLGDESFIEKTKQKVGEEVRQSRRSLKRFAKPKEFLGEIATLCGISLTTPGQGKNKSRWRQAFVYVGRRYYRWPVKCLAQLIKRNENAVSQMLRRLKSPEDRMEVQQFLKALKR